MSRPESEPSIDVASLVQDVDVKRIGHYVLVVFFLAFFITPIESGVMTALKTTAAIARTTPVSLPPVDGFTLEHLELVTSRLTGNIANSLLLAIPATVINVLLASMAAYGLTLVRWRGQMAFLVLFLIGIFMPYQTVLVPLARFWNNIFPVARMLEPAVAAIPLLQGHHADLIPLIVTDVAYGIPICTILFRSYYKSMPTSLVEAAKIDGASITKIYLRIILPLSKPMIGVVFIYQFTQIYNEFLFAFTLIPGADAAAAPVTMVLPYIGASTSGVNFGIRMAAAFVAAIPTLILYVLFAEQFAKGLRTESG